MKDYTNIEATAHFLLQALEKSITRGAGLETPIILAMHDLKKALDYADAKVGKDLDALMLQMEQYKNNTSN